MNRWFIAPNFGRWNVYRGSNWKALFKDKENAEVFVKMMNQEKEDAKTTDSPLEQI